MLALRPSLMSGVQYVLVCCRSLSDFSYIFLLVFHTHVQDPFVNIYGITIHGCDLCLRVISRHKGPVQLPSLGVEQQLLDLNTCNTKIA